MPWHGTQETGVGPNQLRRKQPLGNHFRGPVQILQQFVEQPRALNQSCGDEVPLLRRNQQGD